MPADGAAEPANGADVKATARPLPTYRLRIIDTHGSSYVLIGSKNDVGHALDWLEHRADQAWLRLSGFEDDAGRAAIQMVIEREQIAGMILTRV